MKDTKKPRSLNGAGLQLSLLDTHRRAGAKVSGCPGSAGAPSWRPSSSRHYCGPASPRRGGASTAAETAPVGTISGRVGLVSGCPAILRLRASWGLPAGVEVAALAPAVGPPAVSASTGGRNGPCRHDFWPGGAGVQLPCNPSPVGSLGPLRWRRWPSCRKAPRRWWPTLLRPGQGASRGRPQRGIEKAPAGTISGAAGLVSVRPSILRLRGSLLAPCGR